MRISALGLAFAILLPGCSSKGKTSETKSELVQTTAPKSEVVQTTAPKSEVVQTTAPLSALASPITDASLVDAARTSDYFRVEVWHTEPKASDPVVVSFPSLRVKSASFDPGNLEGASAELIVDLTALSSGSKKRDKHLRDPDFFDTDKHPLATIKISGVKRKSEAIYQALADVEVHGEEQHWPVTFTLVDSTETSVTIEATHKFDRNDFKVGDANTDSIAGPVEAEVRVTLTK